MGITWQKAKEAYKIIKGTPHYRYAALLLTCGSALIAGPQILYYILIKLFDISLDEAGLARQNLIEGSAFWVGIGLILVSIAVFVHFEKRSHLRPAPDSVFFDSPDGWDFKSVAKNIASLDGVQVQFIGFQEEHLAARLKGARLKLDFLEDAMGELRHLSLDTPIPEFKVYEDGARIVLKVNDGKKNSDP